jgi:molybdenum cofactor cytidylyltransferase
MIGAVVLAAGESRRMGRPKMLLPWEETTVIGQVVSTLLTAGIDDVVVVTGALQEQIVALLDGLAARVVLNPDYANGEMARSLQVGIEGLNPSCKATLVVLGDQPQMETKTVLLVLAAYQQDNHSIIVPSFERRRGHPWLVDRSLWGKFLALSSPNTMRDFLDAHSQKIFYLPVNSKTIFSDLDTPEDYARFHPK